LTSLVAATVEVAITLVALSFTAHTNCRTMEDANQGSKPKTEPLTTQTAFSPAGRWVSERGLLLATGDATLERYKALLFHKFEEVEDLVPADGCLLLVLRRGAAVSPHLRDALTAPLVARSAGVGTLHEIAVEYGGMAGPDLKPLAERAGMEVAAYIRNHASAEYTVGFLGFQPGFPYLSGLPRVLHTPRRASPRVRVSAGSVAIGGRYTGIYPTSGPGGWQIIGRTREVLFDPTREAPALLMPGDRVRFVPI
jgi:KipI family sensor histidine kinase inhibitor